MLSRANVVVFPFRFGGKFWGTGPARDNMCISKATLVGNVSYIRLEISLVIGVDTRQKFQTLDREAFSTFASLRSCVWRVFIVWSKKYTYESKFSAHRLQTMRLDSFQRDRFIRWNRSLSMENKNLTCVESRLLFNSFDIVGDKIPLSNHWKITTKTLHPIWKKQYRDTNDRQ